MESTLPESMLLKFRIEGLPPRVQQAFEITQETAGWEKRMKLTLKGRADKIGRAVYAFTIWGLTLFGAWTLGTAWLVIGGLIATVLSLLVILAFASSMRDEEGLLENAKKKLHVHGAVQWLLLTIFGMFCAPIFYLATVQTSTKAKALVNDRYFSKKDDSRFAYIADLYEQMTEWNKIVETIDQALAQVKHGLVGEVPGLNELIEDLEEDQEYIRRQLLYVAEVLQSGELGDPDCATIDLSDLIATNSHRFERTQERAQEVSDKIQRARAQMEVERTRI